MTIDRLGWEDARRAFATARRRAQLRGLLAAFGQRSDGLLSYDDVRSRLHAVEAAVPTLEDVPVDAIVGSVGRYNDFTREFLPKSDADRERWVNVSMAMASQLGTPPVELYRLGDAYFVRDGNHRVSVARQLGASTIQAYVTHVHARAPLPAHASPDDVILAQEHARFLEDTALDQLRPAADVALTAPGGYDALREHIAVHRYFMGIDEDRPIGEAEAVAHWYDHVYASVVDAIRASGALRDFPGRTEADLYLWLSDHRGRLADALGFQIPSERLAEHVVTARPAEEGRAEMAATIRRTRRAPAAEPGIVDDLLVVLEATAGDDDVEVTIAQALAVARRERASVYGVLVTGGGADDAPGGPAERVRRRFDAATRATGVPGQFTTAAGSRGEVVRARMPWFDALVLRAALPAPLPDGSRTRRVPRGYRPLFGRPPRPILTVAARPSPLEHALVAYDGSTASDVALYAAAYMAAKWGTRLTVATVAGRGARAAARKAQDAARATLEGFDVTADYEVAAGPVVEALASAARERGCDLFVLRAYRLAWVESMLGGVLERLVERDERPVLIV